MTPPIVDLKPSCVWFFRDASYKPTDSFTTGTAVIRSSLASNIARAVLYRDTPGDRQENFKLVFPRDTDPELVARVYHSVPQNPIYTLFTVEKTVGTVVQHEDPTRNVQELASYFPPSFLISVLDRLYRPLQARIEGVATNWLAIMRKITTLPQPEYLTFRPHPLFRNAFVRLYSIESPLTSSLFYYKERLLAENNDFETYRLLPYPISVVSPSLLMTKRKDASLGDRQRVPPVFEKMESLKELYSVHIPFLEKMGQIEYAKSHDEGVHSVRWIEVEHNYTSLRSYFQSSIAPKTKFLLVQKIFHALALMHQHGFVKGNLSYDTILVRVTTDGAEPYITDFRTLSKVGSPLCAVDQLPFLPPHLFERIRTQQSIEADASIDCWFMGDLVHHLLFGYSLLERVQVGTQLLLKDAAYRRKYMQIQQGGLQGVMTYHNPLSSIITIIFSTPSEQWPSLQVAWKVLRDHNRILFSSPLEPHGSLFLSDIEDEFPTAGTLLVHNVLEAPLSLPVRVGKLAPQVFRAEDEVRHRALIQTIMPSPGFREQIHVFVPQAFLKEGPPQASIIALIRELVISPLFPIVVSSLRTIEQAIVTSCNPAFALETQATALPRPSFMYLLQRVLPVLQKRVLQEAQPSGLLQAMCSAPEVEWRENRFVSKPIFWVYSVDEKRRAEFFEVESIQVTGSVEKTILKIPVSLGMTKQVEKRELTRVLGAGFIPYLQASLGQEDDFQNLLYEARAFLFLEQSNVPYILRRTRMQFVDMKGHITPAFLNESHDGTLLDYLVHEKSAEKRFSLAYQLTRALCCMQKERIFHYNLRPETIFIKEREGHVELRIGHLRHVHYFGGYIPTVADLEELEAPPPEIFESRIFRVFSPYVDLWNLGEILGRLLFDHSYVKTYDLDSSRVEKRILGLDRMESAFYTLSPPIDPMARIIHRLLSRTPELRPSATEVLTTLIQYARDHNLEFVLTQQP